MSNLILLINNPSSKIQLRHQHFIVLDARCFSVPELRENTVRRTPSSKNSQQIFVSYFHLVVCWFLRYDPGSVMNLHPRISPGSVFPFSQTLNALVLSKGVAVLAFHQCRMF